MTVAEIRDEQPKAEGSSTIVASSYGGGADAVSDTESEAVAGGAAEDPLSGPSARPAARRPVAFQSNHALKFGLEVVAHDPATGRVAAVLCLFCKHFGREPKAGAKRRATTNFKYFKGVFRTDQYLQHHRLQHPVKWVEYDAASLREKQAFFPRYLMAVDSVMGDQRPASVRADKDKSKRQRRVESGDEGSQSKESVRIEQTPKEPSRFEISTAIAALFFGSNPWQPCSVVVQKASGPSSLLADIESSMFSPVAADTVLVPEVYRGAVTDRLCFDVAVDLCASGLMTSQITRTMQAMASYVPNSATLSSAWDDLVEDFTQVATMGSLTVLSSLLAGSWAFSIGFHRHSATTVAARVRFFHSGLQDFHLCYFSLELTSDNLLQVLDCAHPAWRHALVGVSVDGDLSIEISRVAHSLKSRSSASEKVWVTWNGSALLEYALSDFFNQLQNGQFAKTFHRLKSYVKSHSRLIEEIGHEPQILGASRSHDNSILAVFATAEWFTEKRVRIRKFLEEQNEPESSRPSESWWLCLAIFHWIASPTENVLKTIRTHLGRLAPTEQIPHIRELRSDVTNAFRVSSMDGFVGEGNSVLYTSRGESCAVSKTGILEFVVELGSFVNSLLTTLHHEELDVALESLGTCIATFAETLERGLADATEFVLLDGSALLTALPSPVLPHELARLNGKEFSALVDSYKTVLASRFSDERLDLMDQEHQALKRATREKDFREWSSDALVDRGEEFDSAWLKTTGRFRTLQAFAGGLASVLPRQRTSFEPRDSRAAPTTRSLLSIRVEAPRHAAQFHQLCALCKPQSAVI